MGISWLRYQLPAAAHAWASRCRLATVVSSGSDKGDCGLMPRHSTPACAKFRLQPSEPATAVDHVAVIIAIGSPQPPVGLLPR